MEVDEAVRAATIAPAKRWFDTCNESEAQLFGRPFTDEERGSSGRRLGSNLPNSVPSFLQRRHSTTFGTPGQRITTCRRFGVGIQQDTTENRVSDGEGSRSSTRKPQDPNVGTSVSAQG